MARRPSFQFYNADWLSNVNLRRCSFEERGIWVDLLCYFHDSSEYGMLRWSIKEISNTLGCSVKKLYGLVKKGVLKGTDSSTEEVFFSEKFVQKKGNFKEIFLINGEKGPLWFSSRMLKDEYIRKRRSEGGCKSLLHPNVPKKIHEKDTYKEGDKVSLSPSFGCTTSSTTSTEIKNKIKEKIKKEKMVDEKIILPDWIPEAIWSEFLQHRKSKKSPMSILSQTKAVNKLKKWHDEGQDVIEIINNTIMQGWLGLFPLHDQHKEKANGNAISDKNIRPGKHNSNWQWDYLEERVRRESDNSNEIDLSSEVRLQLPDAKGH